MDLLSVLREHLATGRPPTELPPVPRPATAAEAAIWRFLRAWHDVPELGPDHAVLLRQIARWQPNVMVSRLPERLGALGRRARVTMTPTGVLEAEPFLPSWLGDDAIGPSIGIDGPPSLRRSDEAVPAEAYLRKVGYETWQSAAQKEAAWISLTAPPSSTTLIALPTGAGKSLCFQLLARFGTGLTVVIVPTVALAMDQWRSACEVFPAGAAVSPQYFAADERAGGVVDLVRRRATRLLFTSPESCVSGRLKDVLDEAAATNWLQHLVIDEAHIIETWGMFFRVDFQLLSVLRRRWTDRPDSGLRTFLFSATFTEKCREVLRSLYWDEGTPWREFVSHRLRSEMTYYVHEFASSMERDAAILECAWHLPRPALFYTTKPDEARDLANAIRAQGFSRVGCFSGDTGAQDRRALIEGWRADRIDIMVATSAFGLGVDKRDVRAVVHACLPEDLHRYYQEVGRGGRDGWSTVSLLLPTVGDRGVALKLAAKLLRPETLQGRWNALWATAEAVDEDRHRYRLCLNAKAVDYLGTRTFGEHVRWNKRLVLQLLRARRLDLLDINYQSRDADDGLEWVTVELHFAPSGDIAALIADQRDEEMATLRSGYQAMEKYLDDEECISRTLQVIYGRETTQRVCGGCRDCRRAGRRASCPEFLIPRHPNSQPMLTIVGGGPDLLTRAGAEEWVRLFRKLISNKVRRFACSAKHHVRVLDVCAQADPEGRYLYRVDPFDENHPVDVSSEEAVVVLHIAHIDQQVLRVRTGRSIDHLLGAEIGRYLDPSGRYPLESEGAMLTDVRRWTRVH